MIKNILLAGLATIALQARAQAVEDVQAVEAVQDIEAVEEALETPQEDEDMLVLDEAEEEGELTEEQQAKKDAAFKLKSKYPPGKIIPIKDETFKELVTDLKHLMVMEIKGERCGGGPKCRDFYKAIQDAARTVGKMNPPQYIAFVELLHEEKYAEKYHDERKGNPVLKWFTEKNGKVKGGDKILDLLTSGEELANYIMKTAGTGIDTISKCRNIRKRLELRNLNLVYFGEQSGNLYKVFKKQARNKEHMVNKFNFYQTSAECAEAYNVTAPGMAMFRQFDKFQPLVFEGAHTTKSFLDFVDKNFAPEVINFKLDNAEPLFRFGWRSLFLLTESKKADYNTPFAEAAKELKGQALFVKSGISKGDGRNLAVSLKVIKEDLPALIMQQPVDPQLGLTRYRYQGDLSKLTVEKIKDFMEDVKAGDIDRMVLSHPIPKLLGGMKEPAATIIVGKTWKQLVMDDPDKTWIIYLHFAADRQTGDSVQMIERMAAKYKLEGLEYGVLDLNGNEIPGINLRTPQTTLWFGKGPKTNRNWEDITSLIPNQRKMADYITLIRKKMPEFDEKYPVYKTFEEKQLEKKKKAQEKKDEEARLADEALDVIDPNVEL